MLEVKKRGREIIIRKNFKYIGIDLGTIDVKIPVVEIGENNANNRLAISCCVHGNETSSLFIIENLLKTIKTYTLDGYIKIILISNPIATFFHGRCSPQDMQDMNRIAPGNDNGTVSERICRYVLNEIISCNYYIDIHEWAIPSLLQGILVDNPRKEVEAISKGILNMFNPDIITTIDSRYVNSMYGFLNRIKCIPGITIELSNDVSSNAAKEQRVVQSLLNVIKYLKIYTQTDIILSKKNWITVKKVKTLIAQKNGLFFPLRTVGCNIKNKDKIGFIMDLDFQKKTDLYTQGNGVIIQLSTKKFVNAGDLICTIGKKD